MRLFWRATGWWLSIVLGLAFFAGLVVGITGISDGGYFVSLWALVVALIVGAQLLRGITRDRGRFGVGDFHYRADDLTGLTVEGPFGSQTLAWDTYRSFVLDHGYLYLHLARSRAQVIPLEAAPEVGELISWLREHKPLVVRGK